VVVVVFELAAGAIATGVIATAGGLVVSYCRVVVVSVTWVVGAHPTSHIIERPAKMATRKLLAHLIIAAPR
jgi:hypothetical protein